MTADPVTIAYYYRTSWGHHDEFVELFERNHWPVLREQLTSGRFLDVRSYVPRFHGDGRADWDYLVTITYRDWDAVAGHSDEAVKQRLFPDRAAYAVEEAHRFELLEAHWDVPLDERHLPR